MENLITNKNFVKTRALGVVRPAVEITTSGLDSDGKVFSCYKDCVRQAIKIINAVGNRNFITKKYFIKGLCRRVCRSCRRLLSCTFGIFGFQR